MAGSERMQPLVQCRLLLLHTPPPSHLQLYCLQFLNWLVPGLCKEKASSDDLSTEQ